MRTIGIVSIVLAVICVISFGIAIALGPVMLFQGFESQNVNQFEKISSSGVNELKLNLLDSELKIYPIEGNEFEFTLTGTYAKNEYNKSVELSVEKTGDILDVTVIYPDWLVLINRNLYLAVGVPKGYSGTFSIITASGDVDIRNLDATEFKITSASGEVDIENIKASGEASVKTASGDIDIKEFNSDNLIIESISGEVNCENVYSAEEFNLKTTSGDIAIKNLLTDYSKFKTISGEIYIENSKKINSIITTSGDIDIKNLEIDNELNIKTISGEIYLDFVEGSLINLEFDSVSGDLENEFGNIYGGENKVYVKTTSGDLKVY